MLARGLKSITKASSSIGKRTDMQKYVSDCLGVTPGMRISNAKSDESIGITGLVVPRHSLENDLVVSLNLLKTESGLRKPTQPLGNTRRRTSRLRKPAMSSALRPGREDREARRRAGGRSAGRTGPRRRRQPLLHGPGRGGRPRGGHTAAPRALSARGKPGLLSGPRAEARLPSEPAAGGGGLDARDAYRSGGTGAGRAPTQTRVSHRPEPLNVFPSTPVSQAQRQVPG